MSTPVNPTTPSTPPVPTATPPLAASNDQLLQLAQEISKPPYAFDPTTIRKATVTAIDPGDANTAPTCTVLFSGDTTAPVAGVRFAAIFGPQVNDTVIVLKQGAEFFLLTDLAGLGTQVANSTEGGWVQASLAGGHSHGGNSNGALMYRRVMDNGCWKMQWKGAISYGGSTTILSAPLDSDFRPAQKVSLDAARDVNNGGGASIGVDFTTAGQIVIAGPTWSTNSASISHSHTFGVSVSVSGSTGGHTHSSTLGDGIGLSADSVGASGSGSGTTDLGGGSHSHTASNPTWIGFHRLEYFLG